MALSEKIGLWQLPKESSVFKNVSVSVIISIKPYTIFVSPQGIPDSRKTPGSQLTLKDRSIHSSQRRDSVQLKDNAKRIKVARYNVSISRIWKKLKIAVTTM